ncbi:MAG: hypothetical protein GF403_02140 [Candidatus Coatesbacteria bacterium]|nr:hypothetical protein [Candidatus Coatesbacteria bacterium]
MTNVALPILAGEIAPRFCSAPQFLVVEVDDGAWKESRRLPNLSRNWEELLDLLAEQTVEVIICNGFNRGYLAGAEARGIRIIPGIAGSIEVVLEHYLAGRIERLRLPFGRGRGRGMGRGRGVGRPGRGRRPRGGA